MTARKCLSAADDVGDECADLVCSAQGEMGKRQKFWGFSTVVYELPKE